MVKTQKWTIEQQNDANSSVESVSQKLGLSDQKLSELLQWDENSITDYLKSLDENTLTKDDIEILLEKWPVRTEEYLCVLIQKIPNHLLEKDVDFLKKIIEKFPSTKEFEKLWTDFFVMRVLSDKIWKAKIDYDMVDKLTDKWYDCTDFSWVDHKYIYQKLLKKWDFETISLHLNEFTDVEIDYKVLFDKLRKKWEYGIIVDHLDKFSGVEIDRKKLCDKLNSFELAYHLSYFEWISDERGLRLINEWFAKQVVDNLKSFDLGDDIAYGLIKKWYGNLVAKNIDNFKNLYRRVAVLLIEEWYKKLVLNHLDSFDDDVDEETIRYYITHWNEHII